MPAPQFVAYYRVSTARQGRSGLGLEAQQAAVLAFVTAERGTLVEAYQDVESGKNDDRPQLRRAMDHCRMSGAKLLIAKLDRLSRDLAFIAELMKSDVGFVAVDMPSVNNFTVHIMAAVAEHERQAISERTKSALAAAKVRGVKLGTSGPKNLSNQAEGSVAGNLRKTELANKAATLAVDRIREIQAAGATSLRQVADAMNAKGFKSPRGKQWSSVQVMRALERAG